MKHAIIFFALSAAAVAWACATSSWAAVAGALILSGIGVFYGLVAAKAAKRDLAMHATVEALKVEIESMKGQMALYGMGGR